jgi:hypothetical protein
MRFFSIWLLDAILRIYPIAIITAEMAIPSPAIDQNES